MLELPRRAKPASRAPVRAAARLPYMAAEWMRLILVLGCVALLGLAPLPAGARDLPGTDVSPDGATAVEPLDPAAIDLAAGVETRTLANGLEVVVLPDRRAPVVTHMIWYRAGAADEPAGKSGVAHYLEHLLFKGTPNVPAGVFTEAVASVGGQENAFTSHDYTAYFQRVSPDALPTVMGYEADRMVNLVLTDAMIATEREVVREERASRVGASPGAELGEAARAALYLNHPYGRPVIGWPDEIDGLTAEDATAFYERFYRPDNAVVVVVGDVDPAEVFSLAEATYGAIEVEGSAPERARPSEPGSRAARTVELTDDRVSRPSVSVTWLAPSYRTAADGEAEALELLSEVLSGGRTSRLYRELVVERGIAAGAGAFYDGSPLDIGRFGLAFTPAEGESVEEVEAAIRAELARLAEEGPSEAELDRARDRLLVSTVFARDSQAAMARILGASFALGSTLEEIRSWPARLAAVTPEDVAEAAERFGEEGFVRSILRPGSRGATTIIEPRRVPDAALAEPVAEGMTDGEVVR